MRRGEDEEWVIGFGKGISSRAQAQDLDASIFIFIGEVGMAAKDAQDFFLYLGLKEQLPEVIDLVCNETIEPAAADFLHVLMADDHRLYIRF